MKKKTITLMKSLPPARADGRPLYFDIVPGSKVSCYYTNKLGLSMTYGYRHAVMNDPANSPDHDGSAHTMSIHKVPDDAVIFDPSTGVCRDKAGKEFWIDNPDGSVISVGSY